MFETNYTRIDPSFWSDISPSIIPDENASAVLLTTERTTKDIASLLKDSIVAVDHDLGFIFEGIVEYNRFRNKELQVLQLSALNAILNDQDDKQQATFAIKELVFCTLSFLEKVC